MIDLRIAIVNYNTSELLSRCLASIREHPPAGRYEVVVVDNGSRDDSVDRARREHPWATVIATGHNLGYAAGNNVALRGCQARYFLILNSDIEVHAGCLQSLIDHLEAHPRVGMAGARLRLPDGSVQASAAGRPTLLRWLAQQLGWDRLPPVRLALGDLDTNRLTAPALTWWITGACLMCRATALAQVGGLREDYWMYWEDVDFCQEFHRRGWAVAYVPGATMLHRHGGSSRTARGAMIAANNLGAARFFRRHVGPTAGELAWLIGLLGSGLRLALWSVAAAATQARWEPAARRVSVFTEAVRVTWRRAQEP